jgi:outer membrane protein
MRVLLQSLLFWVVLPGVICGHASAMKPLMGPQMEPLSMGQMIDIALRNAPQTKQAWWQAERAAAALGVAKSSYYPHIDLNGNVRNGQAYQFTNGPSVNYTYVGAEFLLDMLLLDCGERSASVQAAKYALQAAEWQTNWEIQSVMIEVLENAYALYYCQETLRAATVSLADAKKALDSSMELNRAGLTPITDVYTSRATVSQMEMELSEAESKADVQRGKLASAMGLAADTYVQLRPLEITPSALNTHLNSHVKDLIILADRSRSDLMAKRSTLLEALAKERKIQTAYLPKLSLSSRGGYEHAMHDKAKSGDYQVRLDLSIPLFTGFKATYENQLALADVKLSTEALAQLELDSALQVLTYKRSLEAAQEMIPQAESNLHNAQLAYDGILERYSAGNEGISELSIALRQLTQARLRYSDIIARYLNALANLAYATGTLKP